MDKGREAGKRVRHVQGRATTSLAYTVALLEGGGLRNPTAAAGPEHERVMMGRKLDLLWHQGGAQKGIYQKSSNQSCI